MLNDQQNLVNIVFVIKMSSLINLPTIKHDYIGSLHGYYDHQPPGV